MVHIFRSSIRPSSRALDEIRFLAVFEVKIDVVKERGLIPLNGEVVMALAPNYVGSDVPLGQKSICGYVPAFDVDGVKERDSGLDLVCAFDFFIFYPQEPYFFWV